MNEIERESVVDVLDDHELLVASNREPYIHSFDGDEVTVSRPAGGLTAVLDPIMQELSGTWVAWGSGDADFEVADDPGQIEVPPDDPSYTLQRLHLSERELAGYYYGYSNQVLWPLCHGMPTRANFDGDFWSHYQQVNETFADALVRSAESDDPAIWFHDYHLALAPRLVREELPNVFLTQFWHIPWPSWDVYRSCPQRRQILEGLLANDLLGFHRESYCESFRECVAAVFDDATTSDGGIRYDGHTTRVRSAPLGIDAETHAEHAEAEGVAEFWSEFTDKHELGDQVAVGVDRLDYTKGILQRLDALEWLWEHNPERRGALTYVQKANESRTRIEEYANLQTAVERRVDEINARFATPDWTPVVYVSDHYPRAGLAALYRYADIALVSPLRDGMNLVAKEFVASQLEGDGVLVLSEFAGAERSLGDGALVVNPNDTRGFAATIEAALAMPERTRRRRMRTLRSRVRENDIDTWVSDQFRGIDAERDDVPRKTPAWQSPPASVWSRKRRLLDDIGDADGLVVMTDFDGTVSDIVTDPERAEMRERARDALETLAAHSQVAAAIISGRDIDDVRQRAAVEGAHYAGNHGLQTYDGEEVSMHAGSQQALDVLPNVCDALERRFGDDGVTVENKGLTATVHYRTADADGDRVLSVVRSVLEGCDGTEALEVTTGKQVVEIRPAVDWDKGTVVERFHRQFTPAGETWVPVYVGDDTTDEAAFEALDGYGVAVGSETDATAASYVVSDPGEVTDFLEWLADEGIARLDAKPRPSPEVTDT